MLNFGEIYVSLGLNIILLFSLGSIYIMLPFVAEKKQVFLNVIIGVVSGVVGLFIMSTQFEIVPGFLLDTRSVLLSVVGAYFGAIPLAITMAFTAALRIYQGGAGMITGLLVIGTTGLVGYLFGRFRLHKYKSFSYQQFLEFYLFGFVVHIVMLLCFFSLPFDVATSILKKITVPVLMLYPIATILIAPVLFKQRLNVKMAKQIDDISKHDYLTGLHNRYYYEQILKEMNDPMYFPLTIIMGDVNGLKIVNDSLGHRQGDLLLIAITEILKQHLQEDDVLFRWGGDEFVFLLPNTSKMEASDRIINITKQMNSTILENNIVPSISLGLATKAKVSVDIDDVVKQAEDMMYRNKLSSGSSTRSNLISLLENTLLERSLETNTHTNNMEKLCLKIADGLELSNNEKEELKLIAKLHDIGKIGISDSVLLKNGKLTDSEYELIKKHTEIGYRILSAIDELEHIAKGVLYHHEKWDGSGYPQGLKEEDIPLLSRIVSIADAYEVMTNGRLYKAPISKENAIKELVRCRGTQFDPTLVDLFIELEK